MSPYASKAQARFAHTDTAKEKGFPTAEFDRASKGQRNLPARAPGKKMHSSRSMKGRR